MTKIKNFLKNYWVFIFLAALVASLLVFRFVYKPKPKPIEPIPSPKLGLLPQPKSKFTEETGSGLFYQVSFSQNVFDNFPKTVAVYKIKKLSKEECLSFLEKMVSDLGFTSIPTEETRKDGLYLVWKNESNYLELNSQTGQFNFSGKTSLIQNQFLSPSLIESQVKQKLVSWRLIPDSTSVGEINGFNIAGLELIPVSDLNKASVFQIIYKPKFDNYSLIGIGPAQNLVEVKIDKNGNLLSVQFFLHQIDRNFVDYYPIKTYEETVREIKDGKMQIIQVLTTDGQQRSIPTMAEIQEIQISEITLAYYETEETQEYYQPIFLLKGQIILKDGNDYQSIFILPAISSSWLSTPR